jgi:hypothetical protein
MEPLGLKSFSQFPNSSFPLFSNFPISQLHFALSTISQFPYPIPIAETYQFSLHLISSPKTIIMKSFTIPACAAMLLLAACNNGQPKQMTFTSKDGKTKTSIGIQEVAGATDEFQKKTEELKKLTPYTVDELKTMIPETLMGMKRTNFNANSMMGFATADGNYKNDGDEKEVRITLIDCAGEAGSGIYSLNYITRMNMQSESETGYTKTVDYNGGKAVETYEKNNDSYEWTYVANDRLLVTIHGEKTGLDALKQAAQSLPLK